MNSHTVIAGTLLAQPCTMEEVPQFLREQVQGIAKSILHVECGLAMERGGTAAFEDMLRGDTYIEVEVQRLSKNNKYTFSIFTGGSAQVLNFLWPK